MPKPNTRFLRHIIKDTDTHNKNLLAKEAVESRARLKDLEQAEDIKRQKTNPNSRDIRRRQMGDIQAILGVKKRRREDDNSDDKRDDSRRRRADSDTRDRHDRRRRRSPRTDGDLFKSSDEDKRRHGRLSERDHADYEARSRKSDEKRSRRSRDHSSPEEDERRSRHRRSHRHRSKSPRRHKSSRSPDDRRRKHRHRSRHRSRSRTTSPSHKNKGSEPDTQTAGQDSDPLEDFIGPPPPPKLRGRGTIGGAAALDRRFSESYDPKLDVQMGDETEQDPWDDAVEAFRDRQKLRLNQDQRLKDAGFTEEQIQKAKGPTEKAEPDVVWTKAGEKREWDKGKGVDGMNDDDDDDDDLGIDYDNGVGERRVRTLFSEDY